ncbi:MAG TPA: hypothetical protein VIN56_07435 [Candidatus Dormibacteraeota bacterium]
MDPDTTRSLGDIEESEPERDLPGRSTPAKKSLEQFLLEFEERLRDHPGESATSAPAALEGRAEGVWRTPVEGGERRGRRLPRLQHRPPVPSPAAPVSAPAPDLPAPDPAPVDVESDPVAVEGEPPAVAGEPAEAAAAKKRNRRHRRHRRR